MNNIIEIEIVLLTKLVFVLYSDKTSKEFNLDDFKAKAFMTDKITKITVWDTYFPVYYKNWTSFISDNSWFSNNGWLVGTEALPQGTAIFGEDKLRNQDLCAHEYVDVGFQFTKMVCKKCDKELK
jgi:hypothetical protein